MTSRRRLVRLEDLVGRRVRSQSGELVGRIEEIRAERRNGQHEIVEYHLGSGALLERWGVVSKLFGGGKTRIARWDQLDIHNPEKPVLTCPVEVLKDKGPRH
jgi:hypothetical protein